MTDYDKGIAHGIILSASVCVKAHGQETIAGELLIAGGMSTVEQAKAMGADQYDLDILKPVFAHIRAKRS